MPAPWRYFSRDEFACHHCGQNRIEDRLIDRLEELRGACGFPLVVRSGYRCPAWNCQCSTTGIHGPHTTGLAVDLQVDRGTAYYTLRYAVPLGFTGLGLKQHGPDRFLHLDLLTDGPGRPRPTVWTYRD